MHSNEINYTSPETSRSYSFYFFLTTLIAVFLLAKVCFALPAFPEAEGFGADTIGGRGGNLYIVTNTNDSGPGSLREGVSASGPRTIVFRTGGIITLNSNLTINSPYITIAGQTAPGGGITLKNKGISIQTHDVVIRFISIRRGADSESDSAFIGKNGSSEVYNILFDHCSFSWAVDEVVNSWYQVKNFTIQRCIISEGLDCSIHSKGCHSKGAQIGGYKFSEANPAMPGADGISFHHNLLAHNAERSPLFNVSGVADAVNNVSYNARWTFSMPVTETIGVVSKVNYVGNYFKRGPDSNSDNYEIKHKDDGGGGLSIYIEGNLGPHRTSGNTPDNYVVASNSRQFLDDKRHSAPPIATLSASDAYVDVLNDSGNNKGIDRSGQWYDRRDLVDLRIVTDVENGTGRIIDDPSQVGGWSIIEKGTPASDADSDGMPDVWEISWGLDPNNGVDMNEDLDGDGYTNIEEFFNGTEPADAKNDISVESPTGLRVVKVDI